MALFSFGAKPAEKKEEETEKAGEPVEVEAAQWCKDTMITQ